MRRILILISIVEVFFSSSESARGQAWLAHWKDIPLPASYLSNVTPYFIDSNLGFIYHAKQYFDKDASLSYLARTTNGGNSWTRIGNFDSMKIIVQQLYFVSPAHGFLAASSGIFETSDTGASWKRIFKDLLAFRSVYAAGSTIYAHADFKPRYQWGPVISTTDDGGHWDTIINTHNSNGLAYTQMAPCVFGNQDSLVIASGMDDQGGILLQVSTDNGKTWFANNQDPSDLDTMTAGVYCFPHSTDLLKTASNATADSSHDVNPFFYSTDIGKSWLEVFAPLETGNFSVGVETGNWFAGNNCAVYLSNADTSVPGADPNAPGGVWRSTDRGQNWKYIPGPFFGEIDDIDFRNLSVVGGGAIVYAGDMHGHLWKTTDGGDGTLPLSNSGGASSILFSSARIINDSLNITIHLPIYFHHSGTMNDVDMIMDYPTDGSLKYLNGISYTGNSIDIAASQWTGRVALHFAAADLNAAPDSLIGYANFLWTPYEYDCDEITFDSIDTHGAESPCSGSNFAEPFEGIIGSFKTCGISGVSENQVHSFAVDFSIYPNPTKNKIEISLTSSIGKFRYELFDALGKSQKNGITSENSFQIDVSDLIEGNYYLRLAEENGSLLTKKVIILK